MSNEELYGIIGGSISQGLLNAMARMIKTLYDFGRGVGSSLRRLFNRNWC